MDLKSLSRIVEREFGLTGTLALCPGGLSHENYLLEKDGERFLLKIYSPRMSDERLLNEERALALASLKLTLSVPQLLRSVHGACRVPFEGRMLSCFQAAQGTARYSLISPPKDSAMLRRLGEVLAHLHCELRPTDWSGTKGALTEALINVSPDCASLLRDFCGERVLLHGDFQPGNLLFNGEELVGVCDFEYATYDYRILEVALAAGNLLSGGAPEVESFFAGYTSRATLSAEERAMVPSLLRAGFLLNLAWAEAELAGEHPREEHRIYREQTLRALQHGAPILEVRQE